MILLVRLMLIDPGQLPDIDTAQSKSHRRIARSRLPRQILRQLFCLLR